MMSPIETAWTISDWIRLTEEPPEPPWGTFMLDGTEYAQIPTDGQPEPNNSVGTVKYADRDVYLVPIDNSEWEREHTRYGAKIHDSDRNVTYYATVDDRNELDFLRVDVHGHIDDNALRRVPVERIRQHTLIQVEEMKRDAPLDPNAFSVSLPYPVLDRTDPKYLPSSEEIAAAMREGLGRQQIAARYGRNVTTVDVWIAKARRELPDKTPPAKRGPRARPKHLDR